ncbi:hypothetical protein [Phormidium tenue]|uniref:Uncharacterized protein n=1 Tax=Phormidium tenue NIES-30 TaxID=549789 RepID=A0A1U7J414_9CYAN|nr:hypothetical protein [Phormidium tenue]MBD2232976.1 hypothetical protein [Phormidium tenue FACHB-1052]OKH47197.1 hypothetical protein NIES30_14630 [Phormidium tenue NIES-30]
MNKIDFSQRLPIKTPNADIDSFYGLNTVSGPILNRPVAAPDGVDASGAAMGAKQQRETEIAALVKAAADTARQTKVELCDAVMAMQESLREQTGSNPQSDLGY